MKSIFLPPSLVAPIVCKLGGWPKFVSEVVEPLLVWAKERGFKEEIMLHSPWGWQPNDNKHLPRTPDWALGVVYSRRGNALALDAPPVQFHLDSYEWIPEDHFLRDASAIKDLPVTVYLGGFHWMAAPGLGFLRGIPKGIGVAFDYVGVHPLEKKHLEFLDRVITRQKLVLLEGIRGGDLKRLKEVSNNFGMVATYPNLVNHAKPFNPRKWDFPSDTRAICKSEKEVTLAQKQGWHALMKVTRQTEGVNIP